MRKRYVYQYIQTPEGVRFSFQLAGPVKRMMAMFLDLLISLAVIGIVLSAIAFVIIILGIAGLITGFNLFLLMLFQIILS